MLKQFKVYLVFCLFSGAIPGGDGEENPEEKAKDEEAERERLEAIREAEERRKEKHRKIEAERENMRQGIRDKVKIRENKATEEISGKST